tara:strand:- start:86 stop:1237 length:1152 start_codon:yes stop_codon:yes gene_type:complete
MSIALLINNFINDELKFNHFKLTFSDIYYIFDEIHFKVRGSYQKDCLKYVKSKKVERLYNYENLSDQDWVSTTLKIVKNIKSRSVFLYNEDHILNCKKSNFRNVINEFNRYNIDFICYSFFNANKLSASNILPLQPKNKKFVNYFDLNKNKLNLIGKISPYYYYITLISIFSRKYLIFILSAENLLFKIYLHNLNRLIAKIMPSTRRYFYEYMNRFLSIFNIEICLYPPCTPFNIEKVWYENSKFKGNWRYGLLNEELFTNYDDDNGHNGESLIKRGLYPLKNKYFLKYLVNRKDLLSQFTIYLKKGDVYNCTYFSRNSRITICPVLSIETLSGKVELNSEKNNLIHKHKNKIFTFSNVKNQLIAKKDSKIKITIYDEVINQK